MLVLFSTVSFTIEKHYCGDVLIDTAVFSEAQKCGMEAMENEHQASTKTPCCKDVIDLIEGQDELTLKTFEELKVLQKQFVASLVYTYVRLYERVEQHVIPHKDYSPPNLVLDIQVLDQVFII
jgi:hypothetical protein